MDMLKKIVAIAFLFAGTTMVSFAGSATSTVNFLQVNITTNRAYIQFNTAPANQPACATDPRMTIDLTTESGKALYNMALTAKAAGKRLFVAGTNTCVSKYEKVSYMRLL
jgi:hypothetical protein